MKRVSILLLIIVSLLASSFAGIGAPKAGAATTSVTVTQVTATSLKINATGITLTVAFTTHANLAAGDTLVVSLAGQTISASGLSAVSLNGSLLSPSSYSGAAGGTAITITLVSPQTPAGNYTLAMTGITNPSAAGQVWISVDTSQENPGWGTLNITGGSVTGLYAYVNPSTPSTAATYTISFATASALTTSSTITIQFPYQTTFSGTPYGNLNNSNSYVQFSGGSSVTGTYYLVGSTMTITLSGGNIAAGGSVWITISSTLGVKTPPSIGTYSLSVYTSADTTPAYAAFQLTGTSITGLTVTADPKAQSAAAQFTLTFTTSSTGALAAGSGAILVDFPSTITVPSSIASGVVTVNGSPAYYVSVGSGSVVTITTPVAIAAYQNVTVIFPKSIGIVNPSSSGTTVSIGVSTSSDVVVANSSYTTITSQITQPQVQLTSYGAGSAAGYTISFSTGAIGVLRAGYDRISIVFPSGTTVPSGITRNQVTVNGYPAYAVNAYANRLDITSAMNVTANGSVQIVIGKDAGIKNPPVAVAYTLQAYTSVEIAPITSATYTIVNLPKTLVLISPVAPDGLNGYYKTRPTVVLSASSAIDPSPVVYYAINGGAQQIYSAPIQLPDGTDTLTYYARDRQGNQEDPQTATFKVDATAPTATITSPADGTVVGKSPVTVIGKVAPGMQVSVAGRAVTVAATGDFTVDVPLVEGAQTIVFTVTSISGNIGQAQLKVTLDTTAPSLAITKPTMYSTTNSNICEVAGKTEVGATVQVAGVTVAVKADGTFSQNVMLKEGSNIITIVATDAVGNTRTIGIPVTYKARTVITLQIGNKTAMVNDTKKTLQSVPVIVNGHTLVPLRFIGEAFGATVDWDPVYKIVTIELKGKSIRLQVGAKYASVAGKTVTLETPPVILKGYTMVPIRFISEAFGAQVVWNAPTKGIVITYPKP